MQIFRNILKGSIAAALSMSVLSACSGSSSSGGSGSKADSNLTISGTLALSSASTFSTFSKVNPYSISLSDLEIYAICLSLSPDIAQGSVSSTGAFSVSLDCAAGSIVTAIFRNKTSLDEVATVVFEDSTDTDINGEPKKSSAFQLNGDISVGSITLDEETGEVKIPISQISSTKVDTGSADGSAHDMTGDWTVAALAAGSLPTGYSNACAANDNNCHGPKVNETVHFVQLDGAEWQRDATCVSAVDGKTFNPSSHTCAGSASANGRSALMMFNSVGAKAACGTTGFNEQAAKAFAGIDFSGTSMTASGLTLGLHTWDASLTDGWKHSAAKTEYQMNNCRPYDLPNDIKTDPDAATFLNGSSVGWACKLTGADDITGNDSDTSGTSDVWRVGAGGGCVITGSSTQVNIKDWSQVNGGTYTSATGLPTGWDGGSGAYTNVDHDGDNGTPAINVTCKHLSAYYTDSSGPGTLITSKTTDNQEPDMEWGTEETVNSGTDCSTIGGGTSLQALRCYANFYEQNLRRGDAVDLDGDSNTTIAGEGYLCTKKVRFDWGNDDANYFVDSHGDWSAGQDFVNLMSVNGNSFAVEQEPRVEQRGIDTGTSFIPCRVSQSGRINFTKKSATQYVIEYVQSNKLVDMGKPACKAAAEAGERSLEIGTTKFMFLLNK